jgi:hypothetical protein
MLLNPGKKAGKNGKRRYKGRAEDVSDLFSRQV